ncbi:ribosome small subunit-dependent GTPase A [Streptomyces diacarni]|uniref:Small ribosomal subunit biogenesis GTPase RsgA n=1 Tax=Streptomyces diacarni TaxID=2800381 RepID=A0A367F7W1_9ACTN|nr:ribosome small subunit-dependent GTPase A [Streptomyces diacarni]RCG25640.1 ribosome small subunit-dependent GTPase A [Streptomyces diacarni]
MSHSTNASSSSASPSAQLDFSRLAPYGWDDDWAAAYADAVADARTAAPDPLPGRVVRVDRGQCDLVTPAGTLRADTEFVVPRDPMKVVCTGDWAVVDADGAPPYVRTLLPRRTAFARSTSSKRSEGQVLAANVDHALIAVSLGAELDLGRIERFLSLAWSSGASPVLVLTKADLVPDTATLAHLTADAETSAPGVQVLPVSAETGEGVDVLAAVLAGGTTALLGQSGAGKSTLANALLGRSAQTVQTIRDRDGKGRHTTTTRNLLPLPAAGGGGTLIDTPGLRGVGLWEAEEGLGQAFAEIEELAARCRFHDCAHDAEPGCAVLAAVEDGTLPERRLVSYRKLLRENVRLAARTDARLRAEQRQVFKQRQALGRHMMERKRGPRRKP